MKVLAWILGLAALLWSGIWYLGATAAERVGTAWLDQQAEAGWSVAYDSVETTGYPLRFDTRFAGLDLADPFTEWAWSAPTFRLVQPAYQPQSVRAIWPGEQVLTTARQQLTIRADPMEALLQLRPTDRFSLVRAEADLTGFDISSNWGWTSAIDSARLMIADQGDGAARYDIAFDAQGVTPAGEVLRLLDPDRDLPDAIERLTIETLLEFERAHVPGARSSSPGPRSPASNCRTFAPIGAGWPCVRRAIWMSMPPASRPATWRCAPKTGRP